MAATHGDRFKYTLKDYKQLLSGGTLTVCAATRQKGGRRPRATRDKRALEVADRGEASEEFADELARIPRGPRGQSSGLHASRAACRPVARAAAARDRWGMIPKSRRHFERDRARNQEVQSAVQFNLGGSYSGLP